MTDLAQRIIDAREARKWTQDDLSRHSLVPQATISKLERGKIANPSVAVIVALSRALGLSLDVLLAGTGEEFSEALSQIVFGSAPLGSLRVTKDHPDGYMISNEPQGYVIAVQGAKGGIGKSTTALNLGAFIAHNYETYDKGQGRKRRVLVLEGDFANGNLDVRVPAMDGYRVSPLDPITTDKLLTTPADGANSYSLLKFAKHALSEDYFSPAHLPLNPRLLEAADMIQAFTRCFRSAPQLDILTASPHPEFYQDGDAEQLLHFLRRFYDTIVIDMGTTLALEHNKTWLVQADRVVLMTQPEMTCQDSTAKMLCRLLGDTSLDIPRMIEPDKIFLLMMRSDGEWGVDPQQLMYRLGLNLGHQALNDHNHYFFPDFDRAAPRANSRRALLVEENRDYALAMQGLAEALLA